MATHTVEIKLIRTIWYYVILILIRYGFSYLFIKKKMGDKIIARSYINGRMVKSYILNYII